MKKNQTRGILRPAIAKEYEVLFHQDCDTAPFVTHEASDTISAILRLGVQYVIRLREESDGSLGIAAGFFIPKQTWKLLNKKQKKFINRANNTLFLCGIVELTALQEEIYKITMKQ